MAKYLVTGGAGFIGSHTVDALVEKGQEVVVIDDLSSGTVQNLEQVKDKIRFVEGDIRDRKLVKSAMEGVDRVIHLAALRSVPKSMTDPYGYTDVNVLATVNLLEAAVAAGTKRFVCISSSSVYGEATEMPLREDMATAPISPYACSKLADELFCQMFTRAFDIEAVGIRYFNVFGPRQSLENQYAVVVPKFITSCLQGEQPPVYGDGLQSRDFTYVENVVAGTIRATEAPNIAGEVFNIALGEEHTVLDLLNEINAILGTDIKPDLQDPRPGDVLRTFADSSKAERLMSWKGHVSFSEGLRRTAEWFKNNPVNVK